MLTLQADIHIAYTPMNESTLHTPGDSATPADDSINALLAQLTDPTALVACARARGAAGDAAGAVALCRKALTLSPGDAGALVTLGEACEAARRLRGKVQRLGEPKGALALVAYAAQL